MPNFFTEITSKFNINKQASCHQGLESNSNVIGNSVCAGENGSNVYPKNLLIAQKISYFSSNFFPYMELNNSEIIKTEIYLKRTIKPRLVACELNGTNSNSILLGSSAISHNGVTHIACAWGIAYKKIGKQILHPLISIKEDKPHTLAFSSVYHVNVIDNPFSLDQINIFFALLGTIITLVCNYSPPFAW